MGANIQPTTPSTLSGCCITDHSLPRAFLHSDDTRLLAIGPKPLHLIPDSLRPQSLPSCSSLRPEVCALKSPQLLVPLRNFLLGPLLPTRPPDPAPFPGVCSFASFLDASYSLLRPLGSADQSSWL